MREYALSAAAWEKRVYERNTGDASLQVLPAGSKTPQSWNLISSVGSYISGFGVLIFLYCVFDAFMKKVPAGDNPWGAGATTLEWTLPSPPPFHQFEVLPRVQ